MYIAQNNLSKNKTLKGYCVPGQMKVDIYVVLLTSLTTTQHATLVFTTF